MIALTTQTFVLDGFGTNGQQASQRVILWKAIKNKKNGYLFHFIILMYIYNYLIYSYNFIFYYLFIMYKGYYL